MLKRLLPFLIILALFIPSTARAQTPTPDPRAALTQSIQSRAARDVELGKPAEGVAGLQVLFGADAQAAGMTMNEVVDIYETAYQDAKGQPSLWSEVTALLRPNVGWGVAGILLLLLVFRKVLEDYLTALVKKLLEAAYQQLAGLRLFWGVALRRYRKALERAHHEIFLPFRQGRPLAMQDVYVPLRVAGSGGAARDTVDAYQAIQQHQWLMVVGVPGSGKSMLLRDLALTYARQGLDDLPDQPVPILLELNRLNTSDKPLLDHLTDAVERSDFPGAAGFVTAFLKRGRFLLLLDGLDEVNSDSRVRVVGQVKDLLLQYDKNRAVITCRTQVYHDEFADLAKQTLEIAEFSDQQIQRFLVPWAKDMPADKSVEGLLRTLRERPQIMALARNPLLLTMVAYLYTDTAFALPHSRAEFYARSTDLLLDQWKTDRNHYKAAHKRLVLQALALFNQQRGSQATGDRRSLELTAVLEQIQKMLPGLTLKPDDAQPLLDEIVERSGLLLKVDGGLRYQFTHLTLQEFFAAQALPTAEALLQFYTADRDAWREVARLWCGLEHDCTDLLQALEPLDDLLAFECLADAQQVDASYAESILERWQPRLSIAASDETLARAFALAAADPRPRGQQMLAFLGHSLSQPEAKIAAANALALTNLPAAVDLLAVHACDEEALRSYLVRLGDLAVPALVGWAQHEQFWAFDALQEIGTPQAALALVPVLWSNKINTSHHAAWRLAALLPRPGVEDTLRTYPLESHQERAEQIPWIWEPFDEPSGSSLPVIAGRMAHLLHTAPPETIPLALAPSYDPRLVIPLCAVAAQGKQLAAIKADDRKTLAEKSKQFLASLTGGRETPLAPMLDQQRAFVVEHVDQVSQHPAWRWLLDSLSVPVQAHLLDTLIQNNPQPKSVDWGNILRPLQYTFTASVQERLIKLLLAGLGLLNLWLSLASVFQRRPVFVRENLWPMLFAMAILVLFMGLWRLKFTLALLGTVLCCLALGIAPALAFSAWFLTGDRPLSLWMVGVGMISAALIAVAFFNAGLLEEIGDPINFLSIFLFASATPFSVVVAFGGVGSGFSGVGGVIFSFIGGYITGMFGLLAAGGVVEGRVVGLEDNLYIVDAVFRSVFYVVLSVFFGLLIGMFDCLFLFLPTRWLHQSGGGAGMALFWLVFWCSLAALVAWGKCQQRRARNPLHGLLDIPATPRTPHGPLARLRSIINP